MKPVKDDSGVSTMTTGRQSGLSPEIAARIAAMGATFDGAVLEGTRALFAPLVDLAMPPAGSIRENVSYGTDERQQTDLYVPGGARRPIVIYIPGGGFVGGSKTGYRNVGTYFARNGVLAIIANYRVAPAHPWPAGAQDIAALVDWAVAHAAELGGDPNKVFMFGQSAGATHVAGALFDRRLQPKAMDAVRGAVLANGIYRITEDMCTPPFVHYFGEDTSQYAERSPITHIGNSKLPLLLMLSEYDPPVLGTPTLELAAAVFRRDGKSPPLVWLKAHNHISPIFAIGSEADEVGSTAVDFVRTLSR